MEPGCHCEAGGKRVHFLLHRQPAGSWQLTAGSLSRAVPDAPAAARVVTRDPLPANCWPLPAAAEENGTMTTVRDLLNSKGHDVYTIAPDASVYDALQLMADRNVGAVLVTDPSGRLVGILSERDYARKVVLRGHTSRETPVSAIMTEEVLCIRPDMTLEDCMGLMTHRRVRHLPVTELERPVGMVSIGDVGRAMIENQGFVIAQLEKYICGAR
jgi:CBS domain-containing protein